MRNRLQKAAGEIGEKYSSGHAPVETSADGPTGAAYREKQAEELSRKKQARKERQAAMELEESQSAMPLQEEDEDDADYELRMLREARLKQIKDSHKEKIENLGKGHGQYREISQDEFLAEVTSSLRVVCLFYHGDFPRCAIFDHHFQKLVARHVETKFIKIDANKAPFFIEKVQTLTEP